MPAADVVIQDYGAGRATVTVNGTKLSGVRAVRVEKRHNNMDVVTVELLAERVAMLPAGPSLADVEARDAEIDARRTED